MYLHKQIQKWLNKLTNKKFMTEQTYEGCKIQMFPVKDSGKFRDIQARLLFNLCETSVTCRMVEIVCNIVAFDSS